MTDKDLSLKYINNKIKRPTFLKKEHFREGNVLFYSYDPQDDKSPYDKNPLIIVISVTRKHILGVNLHWCPINMRKKIIQLILKANKSNIKEGKPLSVKKITKNLYRLLKPIFRLYIKKRISRRGAIIPHTELSYVINLPSEKFIGITPEQAWIMAIQKLKK